MSTQEQMIWAANQSYQHFVDDELQMVTALANAYKIDDTDFAADIEQRLDEGPLSITLENIDLNGGYAIWNILLGTGGPARRVLVTCTFEGDIQAATFQFQDWFQPWTDAEDQDLVLVMAYAHCFYFGKVEITVDGSDT